MFSAINLDHIDGGTIGSYLHSHYTFRGKIAHFQAYRSKLDIKIKREFNNNQKFLGHRNLITTFNYVHKIKDEKSGLRLMYERTQIKTRSKAYFRQYAKDCI